MVGIRIGDYHTWKDWELYLQKVSIDYPVRKEYKVSVPGMDGSIDLSEILTDGEPRYQNRMLAFTFEFADGGYKEMFTRVSKISNRINGKRLKITLDEDPQFYYEGVVQVKADKTNIMVSSFDITVEADPYKYDVLSSTDAWTWDSFNFQTGIILVLKDIQITTGNTTVVVPGNQEEGSSIPIINVTKLTSPMTVSFKGRSYSLKQGRNRFPQIRVGRGAVTLQFTGSGMVNIEYRRKSQ